ncbi:MAG: sulfatase, partial [Actinobacteria bacterium]|nr:sulfatase [Actinomycetota bacterium]
VLPVSRPRPRAVAIATSFAAGISVIIIVAALGMVVQSSPAARANPGEAATAAPTSLTEVVGQLPEAQTTTSSTPTSSEAAAGNRQIRNVVLLLADDLDWALFDQVPRLAALKDAGTTLTNFVVTESLCCPSRSSFTLGQYVHNHKVVSNVPETGGGWETFYRLQHQQDCLPTWLSAAGVSTAHVGKYLNGFPGRQLEPSYVPPAWDHFVTTVRGGGSPYDGYGYVLSTDGVLTQHNGGRANFLDDVMTADTNAWLTTATEPFFLEFASYLPHTPAPAALRNIGSRAGSRVPISPSFNARGAGEPAWLSSLPQMGPKRLANLDRMWTRRLESGETLADSFDAIMSQLRTTGHADDTLVIVTSDNGYHLGTHRMPSGKHTPYREDAVVPAVLIGPGIPAGGVVNAMTSTIDLAPTIANLLGAQPPDWVDGRDLSPLLQDPEGAQWRTGVLTESLTATRPGDPDYSGFEAPAYQALRTEDYLYVSYGTKGTALYDLRTDPSEMDNIIASADQTLVRELKAQLDALSACAGPTCRVADSLATTVSPAASPNG